MVTKKQHFVPQFYLKGFSFDGKAWAARKGLNTEYGQPFGANVGDLCSRHNYHEVKVSQVGSPGDLAIKNSIEERLSKQENSFANMLRDVTSSQNTQLLKVAMAQHLDSVKNLLAHMIIRNPINLDSAREVSKGFSKALISKGLFTQEDGMILDEIGLTLEELTEHSIMRAELWSLAEGSPMHSVLSWLDDAGVLVLRSRVGSQFATADVPFEFGWSDVRSELPTHIYFPLDWRTAVIFHTYERGLVARYADAEEVGWWNRILAWWSKDTSMVIAKSEQVLRLALDKPDGL